jgi:hypothetical protein
VRRVLSWRSGDERRKHAVRASRHFRSYLILVRCGHATAVCARSCIDRERAPLTGSREVGIQSLAVTATSSAGAHATGAIYTFDSIHKAACLRLTVGFWQLHISGTDSAGHQLHGSLAIPVN